MSWHWRVPGARPVSYSDHNDELVRLRRENADLEAKLAACEVRIRELENGVVVETVYGEPVMDHGYHDGDAYWAHPGEGSLGELGYSC